MGDAGRQHYGARRRSRCRRRSAAPGSSRPPPARPPRGRSAVRCRTSKRLAAGPLGELRAAHPVGEAQVVLDPAALPGLPAGGPLFDQDGTQPLGRPVDRRAQPRRARRPRPPGRRSRWPGWSSGPRGGPGRSPTAAPGTCRRTCTTSGTSFSLNPAAVSSLRPLGVVGQRATGRNTRFRARKSRTAYDSAPTSGAPPRGSRSPGGRGWRARRPGGRRRPDRASPPADSTA